MQKHVPGIKIVRKLISPFHICNYSVLESIDLGNQLFLSESGSDIWRVDEFSSGLIVFVEEIR